MLQQHHVAKGEYQKRGVWPEQSSSPMLKPHLHPWLDASRESVSKPFRACWVPDSAKPQQCVVLQASAPAAERSHGAEGSSRAPQLPFDTGAAAPHPIGLFLLHPCLHVEFVGRWKEQPMALDAEHHSMLIL